MAAEHSEFAYCAVYIAEAHAVDEWHIYSHVTYAAPKTRHERLSLAARFHRAALQAGIDVPLLADDMDNVLERTFAAWPERLYVLDDNLRVLFKGGMGPDEFSPAALEKFLHGL